MKAHRKRPRPPTRARAELLAEAWRVLGALDATPRPLVALANRAGLSAWTLRRTLAALTGAGWPVLASEGPRTAPRGAPPRVYALAPAPTAKRAPGAVPVRPGAIPVPPPPAGDALGAAWAVAAWSRSLAALVGALAALAGRRAGPPLRRLRRAVRTVEAEAAAVAALLDQGAAP